MKNITLDLTLTLNESGVAGISIKELAQYDSALKSANKVFSTYATKPAFLKILEQDSEISEVKKVAKHIRSHFKSLIVIGIGGSDLGTRAALQALESSTNDFPIYFCGDTTDPEPLNKILKTVNLKTAAINVVSKSGETIETLSAFLILKEKLKKLVGKKYASHIFATTSPTQGLLKAMAEIEGYTITPHMPVGGRFSVLSSVAFLPMACAGIDIKKVLEGGIEMAKKINNNKVLENAAFSFAAINYHANKVRKQNILVLMPYSYNLREFSKWFRQLWAESLGKKGVGQTPVDSTGPTDQHSQLQLYQEGPIDKIITFIKLNKWEGLEIPNDIPPDVAYLAGKNLGHIVEEELHSTAMALANHRRPSNMITLPELNEFTLGQLFMFFELATAYSAELYKIDAYDQPGVELSKKYLHGALGKPTLRADHQERQLNLKKIRTLIVK